MDGGMAVKGMFFSNGDTWSFTTTTTINAADPPTVIDMSGGSATAIIPSQGLAHPLVHDRDEETVQHQDLSLGRTSPRRRRRHRAYDPAAGRHIDRILRFTWANDARVVLSAQTREWLGSLGIGPLASRGDYADFWNERK
jgi:hypothetical protein